jgi:AsmA family
LAALRFFGRIPMQDTDPNYKTEETTAGEPDADSGEPTSPGLRRRFGLAAAVVVAVLVLVLVPPLISANRFRRQIAARIGTSIGRPVHMDGVRLALFPAPGFTLENFVVDEDPAFGSEPVIHAGEVRATVRLSSLWRRQVEFSKISLTEPSVNLVHVPGGKWNVESILLQAARMETAPTEQKKAGSAPRFPYIEATGARINFKIGQEKMPFSLTEAEFALWLPEPDKWRVRLEARPARTDTGSGDTGLLRLEGTLGRATVLADVPIDLHGAWVKAPLGGASRVVAGHDAGLRGELNASVDLKGTLGDATVQTTFALNNARRAEFVPAQPLSLEANCVAHASRQFHSFSGVECHWPPAGTADVSRMVLTATVPDVHDLKSAAGELTLPMLPASILLDWLRVATPRLPDGLAVGGNLAGSVAYSGAGHGNEQGWSGELILSGGTVSAPGLGPTPMQVGEVTLRAPFGEAGSSAPGGHAKAKPNRGGAGGSEDTLGFVLMPVTLPLGGKEPATLEGRFDPSGYTLHLAGPANQADLHALGEAVPEFGDGMAEVLKQGSGASTPEDAGVGVPAAAPAPPVHIDMTATRAWGGQQVWSDAAVHPVPRKRHSTPLQR